MWKRVLLVVFILFCIELGLFLVILPWSELWDTNIFAALFPGLRPILLSNYFRGALTGLGLLNLWVGISDAWNFRQNLELLDRAEKKAAGGAPLAGTETEAGAPPIRSKHVG